MKILFVCTGNTCRSPTAEVLLDRALKERGVDGVEVTSAGTGAWDGAAVSEGAYLVALENGLDLSAHQARLLTRELVEQADLILTMSRQHAARVGDLAGEEKVFVLGEYAGKSGSSAEVPDPFGGELEGYRETFTELDHLIAGVVNRVVRERSGDRR